MYCVGDHWLRWVSWLRAGTGGLGLQCADWDFFSACSMFFGSVQNFETWKAYFNDPQGSMLGLLGALYQIGSLVSIPLV